MDYSEDLMLKHEDWLLFMVLWHCLIKYLGGLCCGLDKETQWLNPATGIFCDQLIEKTVIGMVISTGIKQNETKQKKPQKNHIGYFSRIYFTTWNNIHPLVQHISANLHERNTSTIGSFWFLTEVHLINVFQAWEKMWLVNKLAPGCKHLVGKRLETISQY